MKSKRKPEMARINVKGVPVALAEQVDELERKFLAEAKRLGMTLSECIEYLARRKLRTSDCESLIDVHELSRLIKASEKRK
jgi:hypothetical protein